MKFYEFGEYTAPVILLLPGNLLPLENVTGESYCEFSDCWWRDFSSFGTCTYLF